MVNIEESKYTTFDFNNCPPTTANSAISRDDEKNGTLKPCSRCIYTSLESKITPEDTYLCVECCNLYNKIIRLINRDSSLVVEDKIKNPWPIIDSAFLIRLFNSPQFYKQLFQTIIKMQTFYGDSYSILFNNYKLFVDKNDFIFNKI